jgi:hypothetical protein
MPTPMKSPTGQVVIAVYRPKAGQGPALETILRRHVATLRAAGLVTSRPAMLLRSFVDGTYLEIFEWVSGEAAQRAHDIPAVAELWGSMGSIADFPPLADLSETRVRFAHFAPVDGVTA